VIAVACLESKERALNILITGGTGFIGSRLALKCLERGDSVKVLGQGNNPAELENKKLLEAGGADVTIASVTDRGRIFDLLHGVDLVYHLAAAQHEANVPDQMFWEVNVTGTKNVLEASVNARVKRFVHGSTIGVYGSNLHGTIDEQCTLKPDNIYGITKLEGEKLVQSFNEELPIVIVRISETYGPGDQRLLKLFKAIKKNIFFMIGSGKNKHHLLYIDDLIEGLFLAGTAKHAPRKIFVLAGKEHVTSNEMVEVIAKQLGTKMSKLRLPLPPLLILATIIESVLRPIGIQPPLHRRRIDFFRKSFAFSTDFSMKVLGFVPKVGFEQGAAATTRWYMDMGYL